MKYLLPVKKAGLAGAGTYAFLVLGGLLFHITIGKEDQLANGWLPLLFLGLPWVMFLKHAAWVAWIINFGVAYAAGSFAGSLWSER